MSDYIEHCCLDEPLFNMLLDTDENIQTSVYVLNRKLKDIYTLEALSHANEYIYEIFDDEMLQDLEKYGTSVKELKLYIIDKEHTEFHRVATVRAFNDRYKVNCFKVVSLKKRQEVIKKVFIEDKEFKDKLTKDTHNYYVPGFNGTKLSDIEREEHKKVAEKKSKDKNREEINRKRREQYKENKQ